MSPFDRAHAYNFLFDFNRNHASILYRFRDIVGYLSKIADFDPPHLHSAPSQGVTPVEFRGDLWHQKARFPGLSCGVVCMILCIASRGKIGLNYFFSSACSFSEFENHSLFSVASALFQRFISSPTASSVAIV